MNFQPSHLSESIFRISAPAEFSSLALKVFNHQALQNSFYAEYLKLLGKDPAPIRSMEEIPCLPVEFFKKEKIFCGSSLPELVFESSSTTGQIPSRHYVADKNLYVQSFTRCFKSFFGEPSQYCILALLPSYLERGNSSLVYMVDSLIKMTNNPLSGFYLDNYQKLAERLKQLEAAGTKTLLLGVSFALLDFAEKFPMNLRTAIVMETGGMKGRRKELTREELHSVLKEKFGVNKICSEYGMTELLSQAYSAGEGIFRTPPWMKILIRNPRDPFEYLPAGQTGAINVIDLANMYSCSFIQTDDLGTLHPDGTFEVLGRLSESELRGCNLLLE